MPATASSSTENLGAVVAGRLEFGPPPPWCFKGASALFVIAAGLGLPGLWQLLQAPRLERLPVACVLMAVGALAAGLALTYRRNSMRYALTLHEQGMLVSRQGSTQSILYAQVRDFSMKQELKRHGAHWGHLRTLDFAGPRGPFRIVHLDEASPEGETFAAAVGVLQEKLADAVQVRLGSGGSLSGKRWVLDAHGLRVRGSPPVALEQLNGARLFEGRVEVRGPDGGLLLSVPEDSPNARLLGILAQRGLGSHAPSTENALGDLLFQKRMGRENRVRCYFVAGLCAVVLLGLFLLVPMASWLYLIPVAIVLGLVGVLTAGAALNSFSVYERAVVVRSLRGTRQLRYSELSSFQYSAHTPTVVEPKSAKQRRHHGNPMRLGPSTQLYLHFVPSRGGPPITYSQSTMGGDAELERLRDQVSSVVATQLLARLQRGEEVSWDSWVRFTSSGLELQSPDAAGSEPRWVAYSEPLRISFEESICWLFVGTEEYPAAMLQRSGPNFYPGLMVLYQLRTAAPPVLTAEG